MDYTEFDREPKASNRWKCLLGCVGLTAFLLIIGRVLYQSIDEPKQQHNDTHVGFFSCNGITANHGDRGKDWAKLPPLAKGTVTKSFRNAMQKASRMYMTTCTPETNVHPVTVNVRVRGEALAPWFRADLEIVDHSDLGAAPAYLYAPIPMRSGNTSASASASLSSPIPPSAKCTVSSFHVPAGQHDVEVSWHLLGPLQNNVFVATWCDDKAAHAAAQKPVKEQAESFAGLHDGLSTSLRTFLAYEGFMAPGAPAKVCGKALHADLVDMADYGRGPSNDYVFKMRVDDAATITIVPFAKHFEPRVLMFDPVKVYSADTDGARNTKSFATADVVTVWVDDPAPHESKPHTKFTLYFLCDTA